jgi:hypothetical protein
VAVGTANDLTDPLGAIRPILFAFSSTNHSAPSGPDVIPVGPVAAPGTENSLMTLADAAPADHVSAHITPTASAAHRHRRETRCGLIL